MTYNMKNKGFTVIELLIASSLFMVVIVIAVGAMLNLAHVSDRSQAVLVAMENLDFSLENMSRTIRTGVDYSCSGACNPDNNIVFKDQNGDSVEFFLSVDADGVGTIIRSKGGEDHAMSSPEIDINKLSFYGFGNDNPIAPDEGDGLQPRVLFVIEGETIIPGLKPEEQADFNIQTTVGQREADLPKVI